MPTKFCVNLQMYCYMAIRKKTMVGDYWRRLFYLLTKLALLMFFLVANIFVFQQFLVERV